jgi:type IV secretion system protein VirB4
VSQSFDFFFKHLPWNFITKFHEGVVVQKNGCLQRSFEYRAPDIVSSSADGVNALAVRVNEFSRHLSSFPGWALHLEARRLQIREYPKTCFDSLAPYLVDKEREAGFKSSGRHFESVYFLTFTWKPPPESVKKLTSMFIQSSNAGEGSSSLKQNVEYFVNETNSVTGVLSGGLWLRPLGNQETAMYLHSTVSFNRHPIKYNKTWILLDRILPDQELETSLVMKLGGFYIPIVCINDFPDETYPAVLDALNRARVEYRWVTRYIVLDKEEGLKETKKKEKHHKGSRETIMQALSKNISGEASSSNVNHGAGVKEGDSIQANVEIDGDEACLGYLSTNVIVWDQDLKTALKKAEIIKIIIQQQGFTCKDEKLNALEAYKSALPGEVYSNYRALPVMSDIMSHVVPLSSVWAGFDFNKHAYDVSGVGTPHLVCSTVEGTPFFLNLNVGDVGHSAVWGPTGSGKSTLLNLLEIQAFKYPGSLVIVFDKGRSCRQAGLSCGGLFFEPAAENITGVNFQPLRDLETERDVHDAVDFIEACINAGGGVLNPAMSEAVRIGVQMMAEDQVPFEHRTITAFLQYINYKDPGSGKPAIHDLLCDYMITGRYGKVFDADSSGLSTDTRFLAVEMEALMNKGPKCVVPALVYLFNLVEKKFDGRLAFLFLDEAWLFLKNEKFSGKITEWLKVLRKKNVYVVFATQEVADVAESPLKSTIIQQCMTKIYLADPQAGNLAGVYSEFGLTPSEISLIASARMKRDYFYTSPLGRRLFQLDLGPITLSLIGSPDHALLDEIASLYEPGSPLCREILAAQGFDYSHLLEKGYPDGPPPAPRGGPVIQNFFTDQFERSIQMQEPLPEETAAPVNTHIFQNEDFINAVASLPDRKCKDGSGRAAASVAEQFNVSLSTIYKVKKILKYAEPDTVEELKRGAVPVKTAYKRLLKQPAPAPDQTAV